MLINDRLSTVLKLVRESKKQLCNDFAILQDTESR